MSLESQARQQSGSGLGADFDHHDPQQAQDPHRIYKELREKCPVARSDRHGGFWVITRYHDIEEVVKDPGTFSSSCTVVPSDFFPEFIKLPPLNFDPPAHTKLRRLLLPAFSPDSANAFEPFVRQLCRSLVSDIATRGRCDVVKDYARRIPIPVAAQLIGLPVEDCDLFSGWVYRLVAGWTDANDAMAAGMEFFAYLIEQVEAREAQPRDDLITILMQSEVDGERLDREELLGCLVLIVMAGIDTTWHTISQCLWHLASHEKDRLRLLEDPSIMPAATEEFLRLYAPLSLGRVVMRDTELAGASIPHGAMVYILYPSANRDAEVFSRPDEFVPDRTDNRHAAFGLGMHRCLGAHLARLELRVALEEWLRQIPDFELETPEPVWEPGHVWGPERVWVAFP